MPSDPIRRPIHTAELLSIGTELTVGETVDTNAGEIARSLVAAGIRVTRVTALPDDLSVVTAAFRAALERVDLVVSTGGLGPTPDDLTREAVADVLGEEPVVDPEVLAWLHGLWERRGLPFPATNVKQAWRIPSAAVLPNPNGTAPGWFVTTLEGRVLVTLPGPPREMRPMWNDHAWPRLHALGAGRASVVSTLRLSGIGESQVADRLGETLLRAANPIVATYARVEAVDVRISAVDDADANGTVRTTAAALADAAERSVLAAVGEFVWARGATTWAEAIDAALATRDLTLATSETGTGGALAGLLAETTRRRYAEIVQPDPGTPPPDDPDPGPAMDPPVPARPGDDLAAAASALRGRAGVDVGLVCRARPRGADMVLTVVIATAAGVRIARRAVFLSGSQGRHRAGIAAALVLLRLLEAEGRG